MPVVQPLQPRDPRSVGGYQLLGRLAPASRGVIYLARAGSAASAPAAPSASVAPAAATAPAAPPVALRLPAEHWVAAAGGRLGLSRSLLAARRVTGPAVVRILDARLGADPGYVVTELVDGPSLAAAVPAHGPVAGAALAELALSTVEALAAVHDAGVLHADLNPAAVLLGPGGPRLTGFGLAGFGLAGDPSAGAALVRLILARPLYLAPEQLVPGPVGPAADLFAWAATIGFAATGRAPFQAAGTREVAARIAAADADLPGIPEPLAAVLRDCLRPEPAIRPGARQVLARLTALTAPRDTRPSTRRPTLQLEPPPQLQPPPLTRRLEPLRLGSRPPTPQPGSRQPTPRPHPGPESVANEPVSLGSWWLRRGLLAMAGAVLLAGAATLAALAYAGNGPGRIPGSGRAGTAAQQAPPEQAVPFAGAPPAGPQSGPASGSAGTGSGAGSAGPGPAAGGGQLLRRLAGTWQGTLRQSDTPAALAVRISLPGPAGAGLIRLPGPGCTGRLTVRALRPGTAVYLDVLVSGSKTRCAGAGTLTLVPAAGGGLGLRWVNLAAPFNTASGPLTRA